MTRLPELVALYGPWVLFVLAVLETSFVTGLVIPSGMATAFATVLAGSGDLGYAEVALAAGLGGWAGDMLGYGIGRRGGARLREGEGWIARALRRHDRRLGSFLGRHPLYSVTLARLVAFVRTLMPLSSGMARLPARRFVLYDVPGVVLWVGLYMGIGLAAGRSWEMVSSVVGVGWAALFALAGLILWVRARRRGEILPAAHSGAALGATSPVDAVGSPAAQEDEAC